MADMNFYRDRKPAGADQVRLPQSQVRLGQAEAVAAQVRPNAGIDQLGNVLGNFFGSLDRTADQIRDTELQVELKQIERRNEGLGLEGVADQAAGRQMDPEKSQNYNYFSSFQRSAANAISARLVGEFGQTVATAAKDGSFDFDAAAKQFVKDKVGQGTGDADHDAYLLVNTLKGIEAVRGQHNEQVRVTTIINNENAFVAGATAKVTSPLGFGGGDVQEFMKDALAITQGNQERADQLVLKALTTGLVTQQQRTAVLNAVYTPGPNGEPPLSERNPALALHVSETAREMIEKTRTVAAQESLDQLTARLSNLKGGAAYDADGYEKFLGDVALSAHTHGADAAHKALIQDAQNYAKVWATKKAQTALYRYAREGQRSPSEMVRLGDDGKPMPLSKYISEHFETQYDPLMVEDAQRFPALLQTQSQDGLLRPTHNRAASVQFAILASTPEMRRVNPEAVPEHHRKQFASDLLGVDPDIAANAFYLVRQVETQTGDRQYALQFLEGDAARRRYLALRAAEGSQLPEDLMARLKNDPQHEADLVAIGDGRLQYSTLPGYEGTKEAEAKADLTQRLNKQLRAITGTEKWFGNGKDIGAGSTAMNNMLLQGVADSLREQARLAPGRAPDIDAAVKQAVTLFQDRVMVVPGQHGTDLVVKDPFYLRKRGEGTGRVYGDPVASVNGRPVFRFGAVRNAAGETENTRDHFHTDTKALAAALPDFQFKPEKFALGEPDTRTGLMEVRNGDKPLLLPLGKEIRVRVSSPSAGMSGGPVSDGGAVPEFGGGAPEFKTIKLPETYHEALPILMEHLKGSGYVVEDPGNYYGASGQRAVRLLYAPRIEKDAAWLDRNLSRPKPGPTLAERLPYTTTHSPLNATVKAGAEATWKGLKELGGKAIDVLMMDPK